MEYKKFGHQYLLRLDKGEEIVETLNKFCADKQITAGWIRGIGAVNRAAIGLFEAESKKYRSTRLEGDHEITCLLGNVSTMDGEVYLHLHITLSDANYNVQGGHLNAAVISGTGEIVIETMAGTIDRQFSEEIGLNLFKL